MNPQQLTGLKPRSRARLAAVALPLAAALGCTASMPLPPELQKAPAVVTTGRSRSVVLGKVKPPSIKPYLMKDLETGSGSHAMTAGAVTFGSTIGFEWQKVEGGLSFRLVKEGADETTLRLVQCVWGLATTSGGFARGAYGADFRIPSGSTLVCEVIEAPDAEPWKLLLWTGAPSNLIVPDFPSGGVLSRGDVRYEAASTNVIEPPGIHAQYMTGTLFTRDGQAVAAVERLLPGRVLIEPSVPLADQTLFVAVGAAIFVYDTQTFAQVH